MYYGAVLAALAAAPLLADIASVRGMIRSGRFAEAIVECDRELKTAPGSVALLTLKGLALRGSGSTSASLIVLRQALSLHPTYEAALQAAGQIEFENRDSNATNTLEAILRLHPASEVAHSMMAELLFERRSCEAAIPHFEKSAAALQTPAFKWQYGVCLLVGERWANAASQFSALLQLRDHVPTRYNLGLALWNAKQYSAAVNALEPLDCPGVGVDALRLLASALESAGQTAKAFDVLQRAIQQSPAEERLLVDLAVLCMDHKALDLGLEVVRAGIQRLPPSAKLQTLLGVLLVRGGDVEKGKEAFQRAAELAPEAPLASIGMASTLIQMGLAVEAEGVLREQMAKFGPDPKSELTLARAILLKRSSAAEIREAAALLESVLKLEPANAVAHGLLGKVYSQLGDNQKATVQLATAIRLDPADRISTYQLMIVYRRTGKVAQAAELARRVRSMLEEEKVDEEAGNKFRVVRESGAAAGNR